MAQNHINWTTRIQEAVEATYDTHVPPDITFKIEENGSTYEIQAHKTVMGWVSRVFNRMLFVANTRDKDAKVLLIKRTTRQAFQIMKEAIYNTKSIKQSLQGKSVHEVFAVLDLVTRYEIPELLASVKEFLGDFPLTEENVLDVAEDAVHYTGTFEDEARSLLTTCAKFLLPKFTDVKSVFEYVAENEDRSDVVVKLQILMKDVPSDKCNNCQQETCLDGKPIQPNQLRGGLKVTNRHSGKTVKWTKWKNGQYCTVNLDGTPNFLFSCK